MKIDSAVTRELFGWWKRYVLRWFFCGTFEGHCWDTDWRARVEVTPTPLWVMGWCLKCGRCAEAHYTFGEAER
jgi:hypothetical protein